MKNGLSKSSWSAAAAVFAVQVPAEFDVEDFFSSDTDFVVGLDQLDTHVGDRGGEPALLYVEGDLADPAALATVAAGIYPAWKAGRVNPVESINLV